jgi:REP element-mobilizing transposase RayT
MSKRNTRRSFDVPAYYHVYNRGANKQKIFLDATDRRKFLALLARYLDPDLEELRADGVPYLKSNVQLLAYCLMGNHFHLLLFQDQEIDDIQRLMSSVLTSYSMYFNLRHKRSGRLFEGPYQAAHIDADSYLAHITRYIHLNPRTYKTYTWSSLPEYLGVRDTCWVHNELATDLTPEQYALFLEDYEDRADLLSSIKKSLNF